MPEPEKEAADKIAELIEKEKAALIDSFLQMQLLELSPGYARVTIKPNPEYLNGVGMVFGGIIMSVADRAFAYACNSITYPSVASQFNMHFIAAPGVSDEIIAECRVLHGGRRVGVCEMTVTNQDGKLIAKGTATSIPVG